MPKNEQALMRALSALTYAEMTKFCMLIRSFSAEEIDIEDMAATLHAVTLHYLEE